MVQIHVIAETDRESGHKEVQDIWKNREINTTDIIAYLCRWF